LAKRYGTKHKERSKVMNTTEKPRLRLREDGTFHILMISDMHGGERFSPQLAEGVEAIVTHVRPDLLLLGGDQVDHRAMNGPLTPEKLHRYLSRVLACVEARGIPWAHVYGNHDGGLGLSNAQQQPVYESFPHCVSQRGPEEIHGVSNYVLPVYDAQGEETVFHIFAMDSGTGIEDFQQAFHRPDCPFLLPHNLGEGDDSATVLFDQVMWYYQTSLALEKAAGKRIPAILYMHIPLMEMEWMVRNPVECGIVGNRRQSMLYHAEMNAGLFMACQQRGDVQGIYCGHTHNNDLCGTLFGIQMAYDAGMGYNNQVMDDDLRGGREIILHVRPDQPIETRCIKLIDIMGERCKKRRG
jgi:UDP-2,3-diacylglucosamine pyrophosphatase LpxH